MIDRTLPRKDARLSHIPLNPPIFRTMDAAIRRAHEERDQLTVDLLLVGKLEMVRYFHRLRDGL